MSLLDKLKKLWALSSLDLAHLGDLLERSENDTNEHREILIRGDGSSKNYIIKEPARFIPRVKEKPIDKITKIGEETHD